LQFHDKSAFSMGASSKIGARMAVRFAQQGTIVTIAARREESGQRLAAKRPSKLLSEQ
jgi:NAD(P)-dependent dehydrogenase (short-subunit alcohol dehydrogenase family)